MDEDTRSGIFWSAYSLDRTLATTLGRPLTLRDEALDIEFPGETGTGYSSYPATVLPSPLQDLSADIRHDRRASLAPRTSAQRPISIEFLPATFSFRFDRITAEIKLMIFRVVQLPERFPWPTDLAKWQKDAHMACNTLLASARQTMGSRKVKHSYNRRALPTIETKYHQCVLLLYRPSPAFKRPTAEAFAICLASALELLRIHAEQLRFGQLADTWLTAHMVFMAGITMIYSAWTLPGSANRPVVQQSLNTLPLFNTSSQDLEFGIRNCSEVLEHLGQTWSVARDAKVKFDNLAAITLERMRNGSMPFTAQDDSTTDHITGSVPANATVPMVAGFDPTWQGDMSGIDFGAVLDPPGFLWDQLEDFSSLYDFSWMAEQTHESF